MPSHRICSWFIEVNWLFSYWSFQVWNNSNSFKVLTSSFIRYFIWCSKSSLLWSTFIYLMLIYLHIFIILVEYHSIGLYRNKPCLESTIFFNISMPNELNGLSAFIGVNMLFYSNFIQRVLSSLMCENAPRIPWDIFSMWIVSVYLSREIIVSYAISTSSSIHKLMELKLSARFL